MSLSILKIIELCQQTYANAMFTAGPRGRDGFSVYQLPDNLVVLNPRGTLANHDLPSLLGWINDFQARLAHTDDFEGRVHAGFLDVLVGLLPQILRSLEEAGLDVHPIHAPAPKPTPWYKRLMDQLAGPSIFAESEPAPEPEKKRLLIVGHSLGGALAILLGAMLQRLNPTVVTLAAPMCGDLDFAAKYPPHVKVTRYESGDDIVPWLPPWGFEPVGDVIAERDFAIIRDPMQRWKLRHRYAHSLILDLLDPRRTKEAWAKVHAAHTLEQGYLPWLSRKPADAQAEAA